MISYSGSDVVFGDSLNKLSLYYIAIVVKRTRVVSIGVSGSSMDCVLLLSGNVLQLVIVLIVLL